MVKKAKEMYCQDPDVRLEIEVRESAEFVASNGWLNRFLRWYNIILRRKTTQRQNIPEQYLPKLTSWSVNMCIPLKFQ